MVHSCVFAFEIYPQKRSGGRQASAKVVLSKMCAQMSGTGVMRRVCNIRNDVEVVVDLKSQLQVAIEKFEKHLQCKYSQNPAYSLCCRKSIFADKVRGSSEYPIHQHRNEESVLCSWTILQRRL